MDSSNNTYILFLSVLLAILIIFFTPARNIIGSILSQYPSNTPHITLFQYVGVPYRAYSTYWDKYISSSNVASLGRYRFYVRKYDRYCYKAKNGRAYTRPGTSYLVYIYDRYTNKRLETIGSACSEHASFLRTGKIWNSPNGVIEAHFLTGKSYNLYKTWSITNQYTIYLPKNEISIILNSPRKSYFQGENATVHVRIISKYPYELFGILNVRVCQPTFGKQHCEVYRKEITIKHGNENNYYYRIPTKYVVSKLTITPSVTVFIDWRKLNPFGLNINPRRIYNKGLKPCSSFYEIRYRGGKITNIKYCIDHGYYFTPMFTASGSTKTIMILPKPVYVQTKNGECPKGYHLSPNRQYCIRDDLKGLSCLTLGCPNIPGHNYICTSSGICAEVLYVKQDCRQLGCPVINNTKGVCDENTGVCIYRFTKNSIVKMEITCKENSSICPPGTTCDPRTGACVMTQIKKEIVQCEKDSDCYIPCEGMSAKCIRGYCHYYGKCKPTYIKVEKNKIVYKRVGCVELGGDKACPKEYYCDKDRDVCVIKTGGNKYTIYLLLITTFILVASLFAILFSKRRW